MNYKELDIAKRFPRWDCGHFENPDEGCSHEFTEKYELGAKAKRNLEPEFNPLAKAIFDTRQGPFDIYTLSPVLRITRGFLISQKLKDILLDFNLSNFVIFDNIKYTFKGEMKDNLSFIYFYNDFGNFIDFKKSEFWAVKPFFERVDGGIREEDVVEKNIEINSIHHRKSIGEYYSKEKKLQIIKKVICCPEAMKYDVFSILNSIIGIWGVFVSERLQKRLEKEKIKGIDYARNMYFEFGCKEAH